MIKGVTNIHLGPIWYHSEPSDIHYSPNEFLGLDFFFAVSYSKPALIKKNLEKKRLLKREYVYSRGYDYILVMPKFPRVTFIPGCTLCCTSLRKDVQHSERLFWSLEYVK